MPLDPGARPLLPAPGSPTVGACVVLVSVPLVMASVPLVAGAEADVATAGVGLGVASLFPVDPGPAPLLLCAASLLPSAMAMWERPNVAPIVSA